MKLTRYSILFSLFIFTLNSSSQGLQHEVGVILGSTSMQTDYGQRGDFASTYGNVGFGIGGVYYLSFGERLRRWNDRASYMKDHLRLKAEVSYMSTNLVHRGVYAERSVRMAAMQGSTKIINIGGQLEFSIFNFSDLRVLEPYISAGFYFVNYNPDLESTLGDWRNDPSVLPSVYLNDGLFMKKDKTQSFSFGLGTRYSKSENMSFIFDWRWQRFLTDNLEGLDPKLGANKFNDWLLFFNAGVVYKFN